MKSEIVQQTKSGLITRYDTGIGFLVYSPYSGLIFAVHQDDVPGVLAWLNKKDKHPPSEEYEKALGPGWIIRYDQAQYPMPQLLPESKYDEGILYTRYPMLINWFVTGRCPLACEYCYAEDLMRGKVREPETADIERVAKAILSYRPLVVVLTGGDPLFTQNLSKAIELLHERVGIIIDTSGYTFTSKHLSLFKRYNVTVRISFDSELPELNKDQRPLHHDYRPSQNQTDNTLFAALRTLCDCLNAGLTVSVQSVATNKSVHDLLDLGDKLLRLGVHSWRVFEVQPSGQRIEEFKRWVATKRQYEHHFGQLLKSYNGLWKRRMSLQVVHNATPNAVILVAPDGTFYTESNVKPGKVVVDKDRPAQPRLKILHEKVDMHAHAKRYLNLTFPGQKSKPYKGGS